MSHRADAFIVPAGLTVTPLDGGLSIEHDQDVVLHGTLGSPVRRILSRRGNVILHVDAEIAQIEAPEGRVEVHGNLDATHLRARSVEVSGGLSSQQIAATALRVGGDLRAADVQLGAGGAHILGSAQISGALETDGGDLIVMGELRADRVDAPSGRIEVQGKVQAGALRAGGDIELHGPVDARVIESGETIELHGDSRVDEVRGDAVRIRADRAELKLVAGRTSISQANGRIQSDVFLAPLIDIAAGASGRITVVECHNDLGPSSVKGCLRLSDLENLLGQDVGRYLAERRLEALPGRAELEASRPPVAAKPAAGPLRSPPALLVPPPVAAPPIEAPAPVVVEPPIEAPAPAVVEPPIEAPAPAVVEAPVEPEAPEVPEVTEAEPPVVAEVVEPEPSLEPVAPAVVEPELAIEAPAPVEVEAEVPAESVAADVVEEAPLEMAAAPATLESPAAVEDAAPIEAEEVAIPAEEPAEPEAPAAPEAAPALAAAPSARLGLALATGALGARLRAARAAAAPSTPEPEPMPPVAEPPPRVDPSPAPAEVPAEDVAPAPISAPPAPVAAPEQEPVAPPAPPPAPVAAPTPVAPPAPAPAAPGPRLEASQIETLFSFTPADTESSGLETPSISAVPLEAEDGAAEPAGLRAAPASTPRLAPSEEPTAKEPPRPAAAIAAEATARSAPPVRTAPPVRPAAPAATAAKPSIFDEGIDESTTIDPLPVLAEPIAPVGPSPSRAARAAAASAAGAEALPPSPSRLPRPAGPRPPASRAPAPMAAPLPAPPPVEPPSQPIQEVAARPASAGISPPGSGQLMMVEEETSGSAAPTPVQVEEEAIRPPRSADNGPRSRAAEDAYVPSMSVPAPTQDPIYMLMVETINRMTSCFPDGDLPAPVERMRTLVHARQYDVIRSDFQAMWSQLADHHRRRGQPIQPRVSHTFRTIETIVKNL